MLGVIIDYLRDPVRLPDCDLSSSTSCWWLLIIYDTFDLRSLSRLWLAGCTERLLSDKPCLDAFLGWVVTTIEPTDFMSSLMAGSKESSYASFSVAIRF